MANKKPHPVRAMLLANFDEWIHQPRTVLMFFFMLATTYITVYSYCNGIRTFQYEMHMGESLVYLLMNGFNGMSLASLTYLVAISEIPHQTAFLQYALIRTSREKWCLSMLLYCVLLAVAVMAAMLLLSVLFLLPSMTAGSGWSDTLRIEAGMLEERAFIPLWIRANFAPWQAILLAVCPILLFLDGHHVLCAVFQLAGASNHRFKPECTHPVCRHDICLRGFSGTVFPHGLCHIITACSGL